ncbi:MAG: 4Fe-4S binding protein [Candidatus Aegiribacteria sp.]|nr:4Fe-4S binding protein [Candidatus Aegiribacteria sp.]
MRAANVSDSNTYRLLQKHLDKQAVGFPATRSGAEIRFLNRMFTPEEAGLALHLSYRPSSLGTIMLTASGEFEEERALKLLDSMSMKGAIGFKERENEDNWFVIPMVIGMFEAQDGCPTEDFLKDAGEYMKTIAFSKSILATEPSQMRTIPINVSISPEHTVATYNQINLLIESSDGPFVVLPCICRESRAIQGEVCEVTSRTETCFGMGSMAAMVLRRGHGREVSREEALSMLQQNQDDGLVLQPSNAQQAEFVCSCCGCCCGMLRMQKMLPHPVDFWVTSFQAEINSDICTGCGICVKRCQVNAVVLKGSPAKAVIGRTRCIGCGLCVPTCPADAIRLISTELETVPPMNEEELNDTIMSNKKGAMGRFLMFLKIILRMRK